MRNIPIEVLDGNVIEYVETVCAVVSEVEYLNLAGSDRIYGFDDDSGDSGMRTSPRQTPPLRPQSRMSTRPREQTYTVPFAFNSLEECLHTLFFPIWTAMVGGALLMYPESLPSLVFEKGYAPVPTSPLDRIAYYGNYAVPHVWIFIGCVVGTALVDPRVFGTLVLLVTLRTMHVWRGYANNRAERLLDERRQSEEIKQWEMDMWCVYLVFAGKEEQFSSLLSSL
ncbi:hypothetical protein HETIRDRAFT_386078 [Heterobasidion irregulare TC 32-1]|uniref:Uncharacterized protein n=1 Tax=Heterobasidion irregulare (strain TC 32-1) TaxID=747525 RepID=W4K1I1_HETIT|nr:uncharacterized protein HETIRDRAFT_386078 [Heterobasidion irregulare TC 32-1]ETW79579.1 hypothetical protein HETIRDRAFT_386078 [Heterobasidion irregulare TC 32-1]